MIKVTDTAKQKAAQAWCFDSTKHIPLDPVLADAFAKILDEIWGQAWLGNATTGEMVAELRARARFNEVDPDKINFIYAISYLMLLSQEAFEPTLKRAVRFGSLPRNK